MSKIVTDLSLISNTSPLEIILFYTGIHILIDFNSNNYRKHSLSDANKFFTKLSLLEKSQVISKFT